MSEEIQKFVFDIEPAATATDETITIMTVPKGSSVLWVHCFPLVMGAAAFADGGITLTIGDAGDADGFVGSINLETAAVDVPVGSAGAYLTVAGGKSYTTATAMTATYDYTAGSAPAAAQTVVKPRIRVIVAVANWQ